MLDRLTTSVGSELRRSLEIEVAAARLAVLPSDQREITLKTLVGSWREETEPEMRIALALLIAFATDAAKTDPAVPVVR
jgi:hypothetical protein